MNKLAIIGATVLLGALSAGCNQGDKAADVRHDVAEAQATRDEKVAEARRDGAIEINRQERDVDAQRRNVSEAVVNRNYEVAMAKAKGDYKVAKESCGNLSGHSQKACKDQAEEALKSDKSRAEMLRAKA